MSTLTTAPPITIPNYYLKSTTSLQDMAPILSTAIAMNSYQGQLGRLTSPWEGPRTFPRCFPNLASNNWLNYFNLDHRLQFQRVLGLEAYGVVHLVKDVSTGIHYAVKALNKIMPNGLPLDLRQQAFQQTEMRLNYQVSARPNIVSLLRIMDTADHTYVIMEYCPEGDLFSNITETGRYVGDDIATKNAFLQVLDAVSHCHGLGIYQGDLQPENILEPQGGHQVKLADFGLATTEPFAKEFGCGSTFYMSPGRGPFASDPGSHQLEPYAPGPTNHRFFCTHKGCTKTFKRYGDLTRHFKKHFTCLRAFHCSHLGCYRNGANGFYRKDKFVDHQRKKHGL